MDYNNAIKLWEEIKNGFELIVQNPFNDSYITSSNDYLIVKRNNEIQLTINNEKEIIYFLMNIKRELTNY